MMSHNNPLPSTTSTSSFSSNTRMGDTFRQNRAAKRSNQNNSNSSNTSTTNNHTNNNNRRDLNRTTTTTTTPRKNQQTPTKIFKNNNHKHTQLEYGKITSLFEKFGFIYCANRPIDIFFHYSELQIIVGGGKNSIATSNNYHNYKSNQQELINSLQIGQEVSFYVKSGTANSNNNSEKLSACSVTILEPGTVIWETEDEPNKRMRGLVERTIRPSNTNGRSRRGSGGGGVGGGESMAEGTIRILLEDDNYKNEKNCNEHENVNSNCDGDIDTSTTAATAVDNDSKEEQERDESTTKASKKGSIVRYTIHDYPSNTPTTSINVTESSSLLSLSRNDLVEFSIFTEKRSGLKYARNITLLQTEHERLEEEREKLLMESAVYERGIVTSLKNGFGFLKSNRRKEEVYFHYSHIVLPDRDDHDGGGGDGDGDGDNDNAHTHDEEHTLKEGQEMEFFVVTENDDRGGSDGSSNSRKKVSARQVRFLEKGSVIFQQTIATGITGIITSCPIVPETDIFSHGRKKQQYHKMKSKPIKDGGKDGFVRLEKSISFMPAENYDSGAPLEVTDVVLPADVCPIIERDGSKTFLWVKEGDTLLFDVVRYVDSGICRVSPTKCLMPDSKDEVSEVTDAVEGIIINEGSVDDTNRDNNQDQETKFSSINELSVSNENAKKDDNNGNAVVEKNLISPKVRVISLSPDIRTEGTVVSIKDNFGFIRPTDQNSDVYFRLDELLSTHMVEDLWRNSLTKEQFDSRIALKFATGCKVVFDLVSQQPKNGGRSRNKDAIRAERIMIIENKKAIVKKAGDSTCQGYILMEPTHTSLSHTPSHIVYGNSNNGKVDGGRWDNCIKEKDSTFNDASITKKEEGSILLLSDPASVFENSRISYLNSANRSNPDNDPKRGDLVCFIKGKDEKAKDIRILKRNAAATIKGKINNININEGSATFNSDDGSTIMTMSLSEVISCDVQILKNDDKVEGILNNDKIFGICRTADLYLDSSIGAGIKKERPKLNLTVKQELKGLGGKIIAQSGMAKGPDGTCGFPLGWTTRVSLFYVPECEEVSSLPEDGHAENHVDYGIEDSQPGDVQEVNIDEPAESTHIVLDTKVIHEGCQK